MAKSCKVNTSSVDDSVKNVKSSHANFIGSHVSGFMGNEAQIMASLAGDKDAAAIAKAWKKAHDSLAALMLDNMEIVGARFYKPEEYIDLLHDYLQGQFKVFGGKKLFVDASPGRILAASKLLTKLVHLHKTRYGKKLNAFERTLFPVQFFSQRIDRFGFLHKYIRQASNLVEDSKRSGTRYKNSLNKIYSSYLQTAQNLVGQLDYIPSEYVLDGLNVRDKNSNTVKFLGSRRNADGQIEHRVFNPQTRKREWVPSDHLSRAAIVRGLSEKYTFEFSNDVMAGQARDIVWRDTVDENHKRAIKLALDKLRLKGTLASRQKPGSDAHLDLSQGVKDIYETNFAGKKWRYIILKDADNHYDGNGNLVSSIAKRGEGGRETYSAYIIQHKDESGNVVNYFNAKEKSKGIPLSELRVDPNSPFRDGWVKASEQKIFGRRVAHRKADGKMFVPDDANNDKGFNFDNIQTLKYANQPHTGMLFDIISRPRETVGGRTGGPDKVFRTFWGAIGDLRTVFDQVGSDILREATLEQQRLQKFVNEELPRLLNRSKRLLKPKDREEYFKGLNEMFDLNNRFYITKQGDVITPNINFQKMVENYIPFMYEDKDIRDMLDDAILDLAEKISREPNGGRASAMEEKITDLRIAKARINDDQATEAHLTETHKTPKTEILNRQVLADRSVYTKHREQWTDVTKRKKDSELVDKYIDGLFYNLNKNKLMVSMLETIGTTMKSNMPDEAKRDIMFWVSNRTKISLNDPTAWAGIGKVDWSYRRMAKGMNRWLPGRRQWDEESVRKIINYSKGTLSAMLLGHSGAIVNRTQILNAAIGYGWDMVWRTGRILRDGDETFSLARANAIISHVGTDEVTNMLMDSLVHGGDLTLSDAGLISTPFIRLPIPTNTWFDFMKMIRHSRRGFIENGIPEVDLLLQRLEFDRIKDDKTRVDSKEGEILANLDSWDKVKVKSTLRVLGREYERVTSPSERRSIEELRENFLDLVMTPKSHNTKRELRLKYKKILGDVAENRMKRIIAWKLSWWWEGAGKELFTFTESERFMRKQTVLMALLNAQEAGQLGKLDPKNLSRVSYIGKDGLVKEELVPDIYLTDEAVRIARNAVADTMFGMSQVNLGEAFGGFGAQLGLYKAYPLQQMIHDWKILQTFMAGNATKIEGMTRIADAFMHYLKLFAQRVSTGKTYEYDPNDSTLDHEAIAMVRFLMTRVAMSVVSIFGELMGIFRSIFRTPLALQFNSMIRGGENPVLGLLLRIGTNALIMLTLDPDDDEETGTLAVGWDIMRLILPVFFTMPMHLITQWAQFG